MTGTAFQHRIAVRADEPAIAALMALAIADLLKPFLNDREIDASRRIMGLDSQIIDDGTYFLVEDAGVLVGCGGWSRRATRYGGDHSPGRDAARLDPAKDAARVRAMYTHPAYARRGIGRLILSLCEAALTAEGYSRAELVATLAGEPLYASCGYQPIRRFQDESGEVAVPLVHMEKAFGPG